MRARVFWLAFFRFILLVVSLATIACHIAQVVMLKNYAGQKNINPWFPTSYVPYILYFVGPGVSTLSAIALNIVSLSSVKSIRGDRAISVINLALMIAVIVYNTLKSGVIPWTDGKESTSADINQGFATYCPTYSDKLTFYRCWLTNGAWLGSLVVAVFWLFLVIFVFLQKASDIYDDDYDMYDFKDDVPMAVTSSPQPPPKEASYHASSPTQVQQPQQANYYQGAGYQEYDSYYDYPPQSPYAGYKQPTADPSAHGGAYGYGYGNEGGNSQYAARQDDTVHMLSDMGGQQHPQYYSPHLSMGPVAHPPHSSSTTPAAQTPNSYN